MSTAAANGHVPRWCANPLDAHGAAVGYFREGSMPVRVPPRSKNPGFDGWEETRYESEEELDAAFPEGKALNIGLLNLQFNLLGMNRYLANAIAIVLVTMWNFWLNTKLSWRSTEVRALGNEPPVLIRA